MATTNRYRRRVVGMIGVALLGGAALAACESASLDEAAEDGGASPDATTSNPPSNEGGDTDEAGVIVGDGATQEDAASGDAADPDAGAEADAAAADGGDSPVDAAADAMPAVVTCTKLFGDGVARVVASSVDVDAQGNIAIVGFFTKSVDFGGGVLTSAGDDDAFLLKLDNACNHVFSKRFGSADAQVFTGVRFDSAGNILVAGGIAESIDLGLGTVSAPPGSQGAVLAKFSPSGVVQWVKFTADATTRSVDVDRDGNAYLSGAAWNSADLGGGASAGKGPFVASYDSTGAYRWAVVPPSTGVPTVPTANTVVVHGDEVWVAGDGQGTLDFGAGPVTRPKSWGWVSRYSRAGAHLSTFDFGGIQTVRLTNSSAGDIYVAAHLNDYSDVGTGTLTAVDADGGTTSPGGFLARWRRDGQGAEWVKTYGRNSLPATTRTVQFRDLIARGEEVAFSAESSGSIQITPTVSRSGEVFVRYWQDGGYIAAPSRPRARLAIAPTNQFVLADQQGTPEKLGVVKLAP